ncbi:hypothetical protein KSP39_PZI021107 [Platanthera zijinensis]|uniref:MULE transposase domain-containing protein n=1 Tax=Platanthera zijinensis TaxID=2320716 RepID=A0AAP0AXM3_9ASPA
MRTIYNKRAKMQRAELDGGTQIQFLYKCITNGGYVSFNKVNAETNQLESLFFAHPVSIQLCKMFSCVFLLDCTYKTNRYKLPLLCIVGVTSTNRSFYAAFVFMSNEVETSYAWALECFRTILDQKKLPCVLVTDREIALMNAIAVVFPGAKNILCKFHISRNILAHCKKEFKNGKEWEKFNGKWQQLVDSPRESDFYQTFLEMKTEYEIAYPQVYSYVVTTWITPYKEYFVAAWVDMHLHLGNSTTNRVEGSHSQLKKFLEVSIGNLATIWQTFDQMINLQHTEIKRSFGQSTIQTNRVFSSSLYSDLLGYISITALEYIKKEELRARTGHGSFEGCTHKIKYTLGLPCAHDLLSYIRNNNTFPLWMIHDHWKQLTLREIKEEQDIKEENEADSKIDVEIEGILRRYNNTSDLQKQEIKRKLRELMDPSSTQTLAPSLPTRTKGRPKGSYKKFTSDFKSTKRDPSLFEHVLKSEQLSLKMRPMRTTKKEAISEKRFLKVVQKEMPAYIRDYISDVVDVLGDGHCGYRVISNGMEMGDDWLQVRNDLSRELQQKDILYDAIFGTTRRIELQNSLDCTTTPAPLDKWMTMPDMGLIIASCYNIAVVHFSMFQSFTFLPLHSPPPAVRRTLFMGFIHGNHFVQLKIKDDCPLPPTFSIWRRYHEEIAEQW